MFLNGTMKTRKINDSQHQIIYRTAKITVVSDFRLK